MAKKSDLHSKSYYIQSVTALLAICVIAACSSQETPKIGNRNRNNGTDCKNCTQKPTPETGDQAAAYAAFSLIAMKQVERYLDLALNGTASKQIHECQIFEVQKKNANVDLIRITMSPESRSNRASDVCKFTGQGTTTWEGNDTLEVTYANAKRGQAGTITSIEKRFSPRPNEIQWNQNNKNSVNEKSISINDEILFTLQADNTFSFSYSGTIDVATKKGRITVSTDKSKNKKDDSKATNNLKIVTNDAELKAQGFVKPATGEWKITSVQTDKLHRRGNGAQELIVDMVLTQVDPATFTTLTCGMPVGLFNGVQTVTAPKPQSVYTPVIAINEMGQVSVIKGTSKFPASKCESGLADLDITASIADRDLAK